MFRYDFSGVKNETSFRTLPEKKWFAFTITKAEEGYTKKSNEPMIKLRAEVINDPEWNGTGVLHAVTFMKDKDAPGAGMSKHFMHSIGIEGDAEVDVNAEDWVGRKFMATTVVEEYNGKKNSKIKLVKATETSEIPF